MATQIERKRESLKKLERQQDLKRLKMAEEHLDSALETINKGFNDPIFNQLGNELIVATASVLVEIRTILEEATPSVG